MLCHASNLLVGMVHDIGSLVKACRDFCPERRNAENARNEADFGHAVHNTTAEVHLLLTSMPSKSNPLMSRPLREPVCIYYLKWGGRPQHFSLAHCRLCSCMMTPQSNVSHLLDRSYTRKAIESILGKWKSFIGQQGTIFWIREGAERAMMRRLSVTTRGRKGTQRLRTPGGLTTESVEATCRSAISI